MVSDNHFEKKLLEEQQSKGSGDPTEADEQRIASLTKRLTSGSYLNNAGWGQGKKNTQAVIKIISKGRGAFNTRRLFNYLARDEKAFEGDYQDIEQVEGLEQEDWSQTLTMYDNHGRELKTKSERNALLKEWKEDFKAHEAYEKQAWKKDINNWLERRVFQLKAKKTYELGERTMLADYQKFMKNQFIDRPLTDKEKQSLFEYSKRSEYFVNKAKGAPLNLKVLGADDTTHMMLSFGEGTNKINPKTAQRQVGQFLDKVLNKHGYDYVYVVHNDKHHAHAHVVIKNHGNLLTKTSKKGFGYSD